jgi:adenylosuccinate synthase
MPMSDFDTIKICTGYLEKGKNLDIIPYDLNDITGPVYVEMKGWKKDIREVTDQSGIPAELNDYIRFIEKETGIPITIVSLGPDRRQIIFRN